MNRIGLLFAILIIGIHGASAQVRQFNLPPEYAAGFDPFAPVGPKQMAAGDFNHDGNRDIAFIHGVGFGSVVTVMLGNGDGSFRPAMDFQTAFGPASIAVADFNGDGYDDLAVSCAGVLIDSSDSSISILFSNGDGTFAPHLDYAPGGQPSPIAAGDFNGDGTIDIAFSYNGAVSVLLNNGDGTFRPPLDSPGGGAVRAVGDLNGDGKADLVVHTNYMLGVMLGNGDGTFHAPVTYSVPADPFSVVIADLNGDGRLDVAAYCIRAAEEKTFVSILLGNGDGTLRNHVDYAVGLGEFYGNVAAADINGDGHLDLIASRYYDNTVSILLGKGDGTFQAPMSYVAPGIDPVVAADFNGDNRSDLVIGGKAINVLLNTGGHFPTAGFYATGHAPGAVAIADVNGDGKQDLVVANGGAYFFKDPPDNTISVLLGNGDGTFQPHLDYSSGAFPLAVAVGDLNGDGKADVVTANANDNTISVFLNRGNGTYSPRVDYPTANGPWSLAIGDFNGDGKPDVAIAAPGSSVVSVLINNGSGTFRSKIDYPTGYGAVSIAAGDFNGDGKLDLATANCDCPPGGGNVSILLGNGDGTFRPHVEYDTAGSSWALASGDFNGDKKDDIAVAYGGPTCDRFGNCNSDSGVGVLLGQGDGTFQPVVKYPGGAGSWATVGDFNGDGKLDLAVADGDFAENSVAYGSSVSIFWGKGDGTLRPHLDFGVGFGSYALAAGDLNGDHKPDLAVVAENSAGVSVLLNTATVPQFIVSATPPAGGSIQSTPAGMNACGSPGPCTAAFDSGSTVTLATPGSDSSIWSGDCSSTGTCALLMTSDRSVTATLPPNPTTFTLSVKKSGNGGGTVYSGYIACGLYCSSGFPSGSVVAIGAAPFPGNTFVGWSGGGCSTARDCYVTMNSDVTLTATFTLPTGFHELTVNGTGTGSGGTLVSAPTGINCIVNLYAGNLGSCVAGFSGGSSITLSFIPNQDSILAGWSGGGCSGTGNCVLTLSSNQTVTANIVPAPAPADFSISSSAFTPLTISPGQKATSTVTIDPQNGFNGSVSLSCSVSPTPQLPPQCSFSPASIAAGTPATLTVNTSSAMLSASMFGDSARINTLQLALVGLLLFGSGLVSLGKWKPKRASVLIGLMVVSVLVFQPSCGGGETAPKSSRGTPPGNYTITITGTSGSLQHSTSVTVTVQ